MSEPTVERSKFQAAIEAGITAAGLDGEPAERLRAVGREATKIGSDFDPACGCPLVQAGLYDGSWRIVGARARIFTFTNDYDKAMKCHLVNYPRFASTNDTFKVV